MGDKIKLGFAIAILLRFLIHREVSMPEAIVYSTIVVMTIAFFVMELVLFQRERERKEKEAEANNEPLQALAKDVAELKHKVNAETLQKGFRLK